MKSSISSFFVLIFLFFLQSCKTFEYPQPIDGEKIEKIPLSWIGIYNLTNDKLQKFNIEEKQVTIIESHSIESKTINYLKSDGKEFIVSKKGKTEIFNASFKNDSVFAFYVDSSIYIVGSNLELRKAGSTLIANFQSNDDKSWYPNIILSSPESFQVYYIKSKYLENMKMNESRNIVDSLTVKDFELFILNKKKYLDAQPGKFNIHLKTVSPPADKLK